MSGAKPLIYFDSCIWIGLITAQQRPIHSESEALAGLVPLLEQKQIVVVSSTLIKPEVLEADMAEQQKIVFQNVIKRRSVVQIKDPITPIMDMAAEIRNYYKELKNSSPSKSIKIPSTPDAIHIATGIYFECDKFFTLDEGILRLINPIAEKYILNISKPYVEQPGFNL